MVDIRDTFDKKLRKCTKNVQVLNRLKGNMFSKQGKILETTALGKTESLLSIFM